MEACGGTVTHTVSAAGKQTAVRFPANPGKPMTEALAGNGFRFKGYLQAWVKTTAN